MLRTPRMQRDTALLWWHLNVLTKRRFDAILEVYGSLDDAAKHVGEELLRGLGVREEAARGALMRLEQFNADRIEKMLKDRKVTFITMEDDAYPAILRQIGDPPIFISYKGDLKCLDQPLIAIVGTRKMSRYGKRVAEHFVPAFVRAGMVTVSGLALGIDTMVAKETLMAGGRTVALLGNGLSRILPESNSDLAEEIIAKGGLIMSEFPLDQPPDTYTFPARNRIIAGLSLGSLVLEAPEGSGAIITAELALEYGRDVFAVPGDIFDPNYAGCHALIAKGQARLVTTPEEVLQEIGIVAPTGEAGAERASKYIPESPTEERVWQALTTLPQRVDDLVEKTGLSASEIGTVLTLLELSRAAKKVGGGWVRG